eukprot:3885775-Alexandrium_andersonii.AAC.1
MVFHELLGAPNEVSQHGGHAQRSCYVRTLHDVSSAVGLPAEVCKHQHDRHITLVRRRPSQRHDVVSNK